MTNSSFRLFFADKGEKICPFQDFQGPQPKFKGFPGPGIFFCQFQGPVVQSPISTNPGLTLNKTSILKDRGNPVLHFLLASNKRNKELDFLN